MYKIYSRTSDTHFVAFERLPEQYKCVLACDNLMIAAFIDIEVEVAQKMADRLNAIDMMRKAFKE